MKHCILLLIASVIGLGLTACSAPRASKAHVDFELPKYHAED